MTGKKDLVILTSKNKFMGQTRKPWSSLNVQKIISELRGHGYNIEQYDFHEIVNRNIPLRDRNIFYAFSQKDNYRQYIRDIMYWLSKYNRIIPSYDLLKCHENKGYQEIYKKITGYDGLKGEYYTSVDEVDESKLQYPVVLKTISGSNGKGVYLIKNQAEFQKTTRLLRNTLTIPAQIDLLRRKYFRKKKFSDYPFYSDRQDYIEYREYLKVEENFIIQQFVPGLSYDYRVLICMDKYYFMRRSVKKGDFRASGTKLFHFSTAPDAGLLDFAQKVYGYFDTPFLSIDVLFDGKQYYLAEFQALHFGTNVVTKSTGYFTQQNGRWDFVSEKPALESLFARTLVAYLSGKQEG